jgi:hypothetical protein
MTLIAVLVLSCRFRPSTVAGLSRRALGTAVGPTGSSWYPEARRLELFRFDFLQLVTVYPISLVLLGRCPVWISWAGLRGLLLWLSPQRCWRALLAVGVAFVVLHDTVRVIAEGVHVSARLPMQLVAALCREMWSVVLVGLVHGIPGRRSYRLHKTIGLRGMGLTISVGGGASRHVWLLFVICALCPSQHVCHRLIVACAVLKWKCLGLGRRYRAA